MLPDASNWTACWTAAPCASRSSCAVERTVSDRPPSWLVNLRHDDHVELQIGAEHLAGRARVIEPKVRQYDRLFSLVNAASSGRYYAYQARTSRPIPVIVVTEPVSAV